MNIERQAIVALKWSTAGKLVGQSVSWIVTLVVIRLLTPDDYGLMAISAVVISIVAGIAELGLGASLVQAPEIKEHELGKTAGALFALNLVCAGMLVLGAPLLADLFRHPQLADVVRVGSSQFLLSAISAVPQSIAYRQMRFRWLAGVDLAAGLLTSVITLVLAWWGAGVWALVFGSLAGGALRAVLLLTQGTAVWPVFRFQGMAHHVRFGGQVTASRMLWHVTYQADILIAGRFLAQDAVGVYSVALTLANMPMDKAMGILNQVAFPTVARLQGELPRLRARLRHATRLLGFVAIPTLWGIAAVAPEFIDALLGERWHAAIFPLQVASLIAPLRMHAAILATAMAAVGRPDLDLRNTIASAVILPVAFLAGVRWGIDGLAVAWAVAVPVAFAINFPRTSRALGFRAGELAAAVRAPVVAGIAMYGSVAAVRLLLLDQAELVRLPILIAAGAISYVTAATLLDRAVWNDFRRVAAALRE